MQPNFYITANNYSDVWLANWQIIKHKSDTASLFAAYQTCGFAALLSVQTEYVWDVDEQCEDVTSALGKQWFFTIF